MKYKTAAALEKAINAAARSSDMDTGRAVTGFYFHRFLCRVFSSPNSPFLLKGGQSMLARTIDARATRDIDLLAEGVTLEQALAELRKLASVDLDDFITFEYGGAEPIKVEDEYRAGLKVSFVPILGGKEKHSISIDLVVDEIPFESKELLTPADRVEVEGIEVFDYRIYPASNSIADKLCAMYERHNGHASSRVKDLVDLLLYASTVSVDGIELVQRVQLESRVRKVELPERFSVPDDWHEYYVGAYRKMIAQTRLSSELADLKTGEEMAAIFLDPVLDGSALNKRWSHLARAWEGM